MRKIRIILMLTAILATSQVFADDAAGMSAGSTDKPCGMIADACATAGFARTETPNKRFWQDCMRPIILGQTVSGVTVDAATVKACQTSKVDELKQDLADLQNAMAKTSG